jgi:hypothetical protein
MSVADTTELGGNPTAVGNSFVTAWMERTSGRRVQWAGHFSLEENPFSFLLD